MNADPLLIVSVIFGLMGLVGFACAFAGHRIGKKLEAIRREQRRSA